MILKKVIEFLNFKLIIIGKKDFKVNSKVGENFRIQLYHALAKEMKFSDFRISPD